MRSIWEQSGDPVAEDPWQDLWLPLADQPERKEALLGEFAHIHAEEDKLRALLAQAFALLPAGHPVTEDVADALGYSQPSASQPPALSLVGLRRRAGDKR
ncbi:MAG: hypothetical protein Q7U97_13075 [Rhodocyclaceae bacterium]|nr:hypothetical protein [Rhodocyclaceae bacterium]